MDQLATAASKALSPNSKTTLSDSDKTKYLEAARTLLGCYRSGDANDPEVYIAAMVHVLKAYPIEIVQRVIDPLTGLPSRLKWLPTVPEVRQACEELHLRERSIRESQALGEQQLRERAEREAHRGQPKTNAELWEEMRARGWQPTARQVAPTVETVEAVKKKLGLTDEQWDALPDLPKRSEDWERTRTDRS